MHFASRMILALATLAFCASVLAETPTPADSKGGQSAAATTGAGNPAPLKEPPQATPRQDESAKPSGQAVWMPPSQWVISGVTGFVLIGSMLAIVLTRNSLRKGWSLGDALAEEVLLPAYENVSMQVDGKTEVSKKLLCDKDGKPVLIPVLCASSSRLIAFIGMLAILFLFLGFGTFAVYGFGKTGTVPAQIGDIVNFLLGGMSLFAPYAINKVTSALQGATSNR